MKDEILLHQVTIQGENTAGWRLEFIGLLVTGAGFCSISTLCTLRVEVSFSDRPNPTLGCNQTS